MTTATNGRKIRSSCAQFAAAASRVTHVPIPIVETVTLSYPRSWDNSSSPVCVGVMQCTWRRRNNDPCCSSYLKGRKMEQHQTMNMVVFRKAFVLRRRITGPPTDLTSTHPTPCIPCFCAADRRDRMVSLSSCGNSSFVVAGHTLLLSSGLRISPAVNTGTGALRNGWSSWARSVKLAKHPTQERSMSAKRSRLDDDSDATTTMLLLSPSGNAPLPAFGCRPLRNILASHNFSHCQTSTRRVKGGICESLSRCPILFRRNI
jgi:hypothetical protein